MKKSKFTLGIIAVVLGLMTTACGIESLEDVQSGITKEDVQEVMDRATEATKDAADKIKEKVDESELPEKLEEAGKAGAEKLKDAAKEKLEEAGKAGADKLKDTAKEKIKEAGKDGAEKIKEGLKSVKDIDDTKVKDVLEEALISAVNSSQDGILSSTEDINLTDTDGNGKTYVFTYDGEEFSAVYRADNWKIVDSYKINNSADMTIICQALIDVHQVHGKDMVSYRTADDMVYEWEIHNVAYAYLSDDETLSAKARDVDFNPEDQGRTLEEIYYARTGKHLSISDFLDN